MTDFENPAGVTTFPTTQPLVVWDGPNDDEYYRVTFSSIHVLRGDVTTVVARFAPSRWEDTGQAGGLWRIDPNHAVLDMSSGDTLFLLPEMEVKRDPGPG
ncbi:MAG TPA: hypothetical protein VFS54_03625 [Solirubrobacterales bacterium]|nr:hypothetical protein [Solirubrobacterales bacterium]